jgi:RNA polymerase sigma factor (sigma-70 family)
VGLSGIEPAVADAGDGLLALNDALQKLAEKDKSKAELVKLRYFAGLTLDQAAQALGISRSTAYEHWAYARAWLRVEMTKGDGALAIGD